MSDKRLTAIVDAAARVTANDPRKVKGASRSEFSKAMTDLLRAATDYVRDVSEEQR